jgi:hypothetical protein
MSLESQVAALTASVNALVAEVGGELAARNAAVASIVSSAQNATVQNIFVDQQNGSDTNGAGTSNAPFKTISKAVSQTRFNDTATIFLLGAGNQVYNMQVEDRIIVLKGKTIVRSVERGSFLDRQGKIIASWRPDEANVYKPAGFFCDINSSGILIFRNTDIEIPAAPGGVTLADADGLSFFVANRRNAPALLQLNISIATIVNNSVNATLVSAVEGAVALTVATVTHSGMAGKWIFGVTAGTAPKDTGKILSNLITL